MGNLFSNQRDTTNDEAPVTHDGRSPKLLMSDTKLINKIESPLDKNAGCNDGEKIDFKNENCEKKKKKTPRKTKINSTSNTNERRKQTTRPDQMKQSTIIRVPIDKDRSVGKNRKRKFDQMAHKPRPTISNNKQKSEPPKKTNDENIITKPKFIF